MKKTLKNLFVLFCATSFLHLSIGYAQQRDCLITSFPYVEGFENNGEDLPECWTQEFDYMGAEWQVVPASGGSIPDPPTTHGGDYKAYFWGVMATTKLVSPPMNLALLSNPVLKFWHAQKFLMGQDLLKIYYKTSATGAWTLLASFEELVEDWTEETILLPNKSAEYYIAFEAVNNIGSGVHLDDITVENFGNYFDGQITGIYTPNSNEYLTDSETVTITVKNNSSEPVSGFSLVLKLDGNAVATETFTGTIGVLEQVNYTFTAKLDLSEAGKEYAVSATIILEDDEVPENDTFTKTVKHFSSEIRYYGYRLEEAAPSATTVGFISFDVTSPNNFDRVSEYIPAGDANIIYCGDIVDGYFYGYTCRRELFWYDMRDFVKIDLKTWTDVSAVPIQSCPEDLAYDYASATMYGLLYAYTGSTLVKVDLETGQLTSIGVMGQTFPVFACNAEGEMYGIDHLEGNLYEINKLNGETTFVLSTGRLPRGMQSMAFDLNTGKLFWASRLEDDSVDLIEIDIQSKTVTNRGTLGNNAVTVALFTKTKPVIIVSTEPEHNATDVLLNTPVSVTFNRDVIDKNLAGITINGETAIARITGNVLNFTKIPDLAYDTEYTVYIPAQAIIGYEEAITWSFRTLKEESVESISGNDVKIYPNPSNGALSIENGALSIKSIQILDVAGKLVSSYHLIPSSSYHINISHLPAGLYFVKIESAIDVSTHKLVIK